MPVTVFFSYSHLDEALRDELEKHLSVLKRSGIIATWHDRRIGAEAIVRGLVDRRALGLVTTHDLALAHIADSLAPSAANVHFEDHLEDGRINFDYKLQPGVVRKSNALELMRSVGLEV